MTQDELIRSPLGREQLVALAREACNPQSVDPVIGEMATFTLTELECFAALVAAHANQPQPCCQDFEKCDNWRCVPKAIAHEREACAKVCEEMCEYGKPFSCAAAIRSRF